MPAYCMLLNCMMKITNVVPGAFFYFIGKTLSVTVPRFTIIIHLWFDACYLRKLFHYL